MQAQGLSSWSLRDWLVLEKKLEEGTLSRDEATWASVSDREESGLRGEQQSEAGHWGDKGREVLGAQPSRPARAHSPQRWLPGSGKGQGWLAPGSKPLFSQGP